MADRPEMFEPTKVFSGMADSMEPCKMLWGRPLLSRQRNLGKFGLFSTISRLVWHIDRRHLGLPGGHPCCHGNDIWHRRGDLVACRLVVLLVKFTLYYLFCLSYCIYHHPWWMKIFNSLHSAVSRCRCNDARMPRTLCAKSDHCCDCSLKHHAYIPAMNSENCFWFVKGQWTCCDGRGTGVWRLAASICVYGLATGAQNTLRTMKRMKWNTAVMPTCSLRSLLLLYYR